MKKLYLIHIPIFEKLRDQQKTFELLQFLKAIKAPFALEAGVGSTDRQIHFAIGLKPIVARYCGRYLKKLWPEVKMVDGHDYHVFSTYGTHRIAYLTKKSGSSLPKNTARTFLTTLNKFSKIYSIGEGAAFQVVTEPNQKYLEVNLRLAVGAPTPFQADDLINEILKTLPNFRAIKVKSQEFFNQFINHEFDNRQKINLTIHELADLFYL